MACVRQSTKKYVIRNSPPYPANECCNRRMHGNDGEMYISKAAKTGVCRWVKVSAASPKRKASPKKSPKKKSPKKKASPKRKASPKKKKSPKRR